MPVWVVNGCITHSLLLGPAKRRAPTLPWKGRVARRRALQREASSGVGGPSRRRRGTFSWSPHPGAAQERDADPPLPGEGGRTFLGHRYAIALPTRGRGTCTLWGSARASKSP